MLRTIILLVTAIFLNCSMEWCVAQHEKTRSAPDTTLQLGDILGMLVLPPGDDSIPITHVPTRSGLRPFVGDPIQVLDDGTITPLFLEPQNVAGLTIDQAHQMIVEAYATAGIKTKFALQLAELPGTEIGDNLADYTAQPGDVIVIDCPDLIDSLPATFGLFRDDTFPCQGCPFLVDDEGKLSFAVIGDLDVEGKKLSEIRQQILKRLNDRAVIETASLKLHVSLAWQRQLNSPVRQPLQPGDIVSIEIKGIYNDIERAITVSRGRDEDCGPAMGLPIQIDVEGNIELRFIGKTKAAGLMVSELRNKIRNEYIAQEILVEASVHISLMEKYQLDEPPPKFQIAPGDVLNIFVQGIVEPGLSEPVQIYKDPAPATPIPEPPRTIRVHVPQDERIPPSIGVPCLVREDGTILLPLLDPIPVQGLTVEEVSELLPRIYLEDRRPEPTFVQFYSRSSPK